MFAFASKGARELPNGKVYLDGGIEPLSKSGSFMGQHIYVPREGAAVHINAFNFPVWGMLEKLAPAILAGVPVIVKPATATAYLTERVVRRIIESRLLPEGALQLVCGSLGDLFDHLSCQDFVSFTGSADTAAKLRAHPAVIRRAVPFIAETDSLNSSILAPDAAPGSAGVRSVRPRSDARADREGGTEVHGHPTGRSFPRRSRTMRPRRYVPRSARSSSAIRAPKGSAWGRW